MSTDSKITIKDVASRTGLSKGTVDRVLHNRGGVSEKSREKILKVIKELGYEPNVYASMLASRKLHKIITLLPQFRPGEFWELSNNGVTMGAEYARNFAAEVIQVYYDQYSIDSFKKACAETLELNPSAVVLAPMFKNETSVFTEQLRQLDIPYVFIDSKLEEEGYFAYYGMPMYQSGYLCADLLTNGTDVRHVALVRITRDKNRQSDPTINRRAGFMDYMLEHYPECEIRNVFIDPTDKEAVNHTLERFFADNPEYKYMVMFNSRVYLIVDYLESHPVEGRRVIGYDNLAPNIAALKHGTVNALISQHQEDQPFQAIKSLVDFLVHKKMPPHKDNFMHMDILTKYNADYF